MVHFTIKYHISDWLNNCTNSMFVGGKKKKYLYIIEYWWDWNSKKKKKLN